MTRVAAVDCGTNSIRLLVADVEPGGAALRTLERRMEIVRLGQGVDRTGRLAPEALERTLAACRRYAEVLAEFGVEAGHTRFVATSATRDAENRAEFTEGVRSILGVTPEVISGDEEARLSCAGATRELAAAGGPDQEYLVLDIGGGSTEFVLGDAAGRVRAARSVDIGCVRLTERHLLRGGELVDPPDGERISAIQADIDAALDLAEEAVPLRADPPPRLVGLAGSVTTVGALALGLEEYDPGAIHHTTVTVERVRDLTEWLLRSGHVERAASPVIHPGRVDVIAAGAMVLRSVLERTGASEVLVSEHDILDGIAFSAAYDAR